MGVILVTGGTRSGKSRVAERLLADEADVVYLATAQATDPEMAARIAAHRVRRPASWSTIELGDDLAATLAEAGDHPVLLDGLGGWIGGLLHHAGAFDEPGRLDAIAAAVGAQVTALIAAVTARGATSVVVVEEAGAAPIAAEAVTRHWVDLVGEAAQRLSAVADRALYVVAGRAIELPACEEGSEPADRPLHGDRMVPPGHEDFAVKADRPLHGDRMVPPGHEDFAVNVVAGGPPDWLADVLRQALHRNVQRYPNERAAAHAVAARHGRPPGEALLLNGAAEGFWLIAAALKPRRPIVLAPAFTEARRALSAHGGNPELVHRRAAQGFALHPDAVPGEADLVVVANPCNPTGTLHAANAIAALARPGRTLVVDEAFMDLVPDEPESVAARRDLDGLVVLRSLTKSLGIPGIRAGALLAAPDITRRLAAHRQPWSVNALAVAALAAWAARVEPLNGLAKQIASSRERLQDMLADLPGVHVHAGAANFLLLRVPDGPAALTALHQGRIAVRPTTDLGLDANHLRVSVRDDATNERLVAALAGHLRTRR